MTEQTSVQILDSTLAAEAATLAGRLAGERVASRLTAHDPTLWGPDAESEAGVRLAWTTLPETSRRLVASIAELRGELAAEGIDRVVLAGMGGASLAAEVIAGTARVPLIVVDTTDPAQVADALAGDLSRTVLVVSSKSGSTVETDSIRRICTAAFEAEYIDPTRRIVVVTDLGSPLATLAGEVGYSHVFLTDPRTSGAYSALTAFGLVPAGLAGADVGALLDDAAEAATPLARDDATNPALLLAAALGTRHSTGAEKVVLADSGSGVTGFPDWVEQLIAGSTGKHGTGLLPVAVEGTEAAGFADARSDATPVAVGPAAPHAMISTSGPLGGLMLLWEHAVAVTGRLLGVNPFDQPDADAAEAAARTLLDTPSDGTVTTPVVVDGPIEVYPAGDWLTAGVDSVTAAVEALVAAAPEFGYLAVHAYLDRLDDASASLLRAELARRTGLQTTFGWGPRFLHSTGQYHKGGHQNGVFLQVTGAVTEDLPVDGRPYTLGVLQHAQALGDGSVLADHGRPVLRLHLTDRVAGLVMLFKALEAVGT